MPNIHFAAHCSAKSLYAVCRCMCTTTCILHVSLYHQMKTQRQKDTRYRCVYSHLFCGEASSRRYAKKIMLCITSRLHFNLKMIHTIRWRNEWNLNGCSKMSFCIEEYRRGTKQMAWYVFCGCCFFSFIFCCVYECNGACALTSMPLFNVHIHTCAHKGANGIGRVHGWLPFLFEGQFNILKSQICAVVCARTTQTATVVMMMIWCCWMILHAKTHTAINDEDISLRWKTHHLPL